MGILIYTNSDISTCSPMLAFKKAFVCVYAHVRMSGGECMHVVLIWFLLLCKDHDQKQLGVRKSLFGVYFVTAHHQGKSGKMSHPTHLQIHSNSYRNRKSILYIKDIYDLCETAKKHLCSLHQRKSKTEAIILHDLK